MTTKIVVPEFVLDAWPVMEWLKGREPASAMLQAMIEHCLAGRVGLSMCRINHGEVVYSVHKNFPPDRIDGALKAFREIPLTLYSVDDSLIDEAVSIKSVYPVSYADAFGAALAIRLGLPLVTGDPELAPLRAVGLQIHWLGG